jgi:hypothetical protein
VISCACHARPCTSCFSTCTWKNLASVHARVWQCTTGNTLVKSPDGQCMFDSHLYVGVCGAYELVMRGRSAPVFWLWCTHACINMPNLAGNLGKKSSTTCVRASDSDTYCISFFTISNTNGHARTRADTMKTCAYNVGDNGCLASSLKLSTYLTCSFKFFHCSSICSVWQVDAYMCIPATALARPPRFIPAESHLFICIFAILFNPEAPGAPIPRCCNPCCSGKPDEFPIMPIGGCPVCDEENDCLCVCVCVCVFVCERKG